MDGGIGKFTLLADGCFVLNCCGRCLPITTAFSHKSLEGRNLGVKSALKSSRSPFVDFTNIIQLSKKFR